jgi:lipoate-protein ligase A
VRRAAEAHLDGDRHLFQTVEAGAAGFLYRTWELMRPVVVIGRNTPLAEQVIPETCRTDGVPILRRVTGGGAVVLGPGCLNYAIAVSVVSRPDFAAVSESFTTILSWLTAALGMSGLSIAGDTDLVLGGRKVSGNAQRRGRRALLHHGTLLYAFDARLATRYLREPARQPAHRAARTHAAFLGNIPLQADDLRARVAAGLDACGTRFNARRACRS